MIFLADIETGGPCDDFDYRIIKTPKDKKKQKKNKKNSVKQKKSAFTKLVNKTAGVTSFTQGEIAVIKSMVANDVKTPLKTNIKGKQKTIGSKKDIKIHRSI